jgi:hypothetical protein
MQATPKQLQAMQEEIVAHNEDIQALQGGANLKKMGVPSGVSRDEAIAGWAARRDAIQAELDKGEVFPL